MIGNVLAAAWEPASLTPPTCFYAFLATSWCFPGGPKALRPKGAVKTASGDGRGEAGPAGVGAGAGSTRDFCLQTADLRRAETEDRCEGGNSSRQKDVGRGRGASGAPRVAEGAESARKSPSFRDETGRPVSWGKREPCKGAVGVERHA